MSTFKCPEVIAEIIPHENADALEICRVGLYQSVVRKGQYKTGQHVVYIPEQALVPEGLLRHLGLWKEDKGMLRGSKGNRVGPVRLRGVLSQGLVFSPPEERGVGHDWASDLGIEKWKPEIPVSFGAHAAGVISYTLRGYDVENIKSDPNVWPDDLRVSVTEKLHGASCLLIWTREDLRELSPDKYLHGCVVTTKNQGNKGIVLDMNKPSLYSNVFDPSLVKEFSEFMERVWPEEPNRQPPEAYIVGGEIVGKGVQDLTYGLDSPKFFMWGEWELREGQWEAGACVSQWPEVPALFRGTYGEVKQKLPELEAAHKMSTLHAGTLCEGVVLSSRLGKIKHVFEAYLLRKGGTEYE